MTDKEKLSCLIDRPCTACKLHNEDGCVKWSCVFDQKSELPEGEYIKKTDVLDKVVIETLSDYTEHDVIHVDEINKLPTYSVPEREKGEWVYSERFSKVFPMYVCSKCSGLSASCYVKFCPNCGADMRGET